MVTKVALIIFICCLGLVLSQREKKKKNPSKIYVRNVCICVPKGSCNADNTDGSGIINPRIMTNGRPPKLVKGTSNDKMKPQWTGISLAVKNQKRCGRDLELCCPRKGFMCGKTYPPVRRGPKADTRKGEAQYGGHPWHVAILNNDNSYLGAGVLIDHTNVLTAAHKIDNIALPLKVRLGEWDAANDAEPYKPIEIPIEKVKTHPKYNSTNLHFDLSVLRLTKSVPLGKFPTITNICLPNIEMMSPTRCLVAGWGKNEFSSSGKYEMILKEIDLPLVDSNVCERQLRATRLGRRFRLNKSSFVCAGGEQGKDSCTGDGGSPLVCLVNENWYLAGLVAWGIGCGQENVPGVYVNTFDMTDWIQKTTARLNPKKNKSKRRKSKN